MQKWEYLFIRVVDNMVLFVNGEKKFSRFAALMGTERKIWEVANQLGEEGWEIVGTLSDEDRVGSGQLILKRLKQQI